MRVMYCKQRYCDKYLCNCRGLLLPYTCPHISKKGCLSPCDAPRTPAHVQTRNHIPLLPIQTKEKQKTQ